MGLKRITAPTTYPVSLAEAKEFAHVDFTDDDDLLAALIDGATGTVEKFLGRALVDQTWNYFLDAFPSDKFIKIPLAPIIELEDIFYRDGGPEQTLSGSSYELVDSSDDDYARVFLNVGGSWPGTSGTAGNAVRIRFRAGYLDGSSPPVINIPAPIKVAIRLLLNTPYAQRETIVIGQTAVQLTWAEQWLLRPYRLHLGMA